MSDIDLTEQWAYEAMSWLSKFTDDEIETALHSFRRNRWSLDEFHNVNRNSPEEILEHFGEPRGRAMLKLAASCPLLSPEQRDRLLNAERPKPRERRPPEPRLGFVYLMRDNSNGRHKIGFSKNPKQRESTLQSEKPDIVLVASVEGTDWDEESLHSAYHKKRVRGEWFKLEQGDVDEILRRMEGWK